jgi:hypothetical protein
MCTPDAGDQEPKAYHIALAECDLDHAKNGRNALGFSRGIHRPSHRATVGAAVGQERQAGQGKEMAMGNVAAIEEVTRASQSSPTTNGRSSPFAAQAAFQQ